MRLNEQIEMLQDEVDDRNDELRVTIFYESRIDVMTVSKMRFEIDVDIRFLHNVSHFFCSN